MHYKKLLLITVVSIFATTQIVNAGTRKITLEDIWSNKTFNAQSVPGFNVMNDGQRFVKLEEKDNQSTINIYNLKTQEKLSTLFNTAELTTSITDIEEIAFNEDESKILIYTAATPIYRRSILYTVFIYDIQSKSITKLDTAKILHATFSPDGKQIAYVKDNNIFIYNIIQNSAQQITNDGLFNNIINGNCDWVYEEEFSFSRAFEWSKNGDFLAYYKFDERAVKTFTIPFYEVSPYTRDYTYKYPKAGESNSKVSIHIYNTTTKQDIKTDIDPNKDQYIPRIKFTNSNDQLAIYQLNRLQNELNILLTNSTTGKSTIIFNEKNDAYLEIGDDITFLKDNESFIYKSEKSGFNHLYKWNWVSKTNTPLTTGKFDVNELIGVDESISQVYYTAAVQNPMELKLYKVNTSGGTATVLTNTEGYHQITPLYGNQYFLDRYSTATTAPIFTLIDNEGKSVRVLEENKSLTKKLKTFDLSPVEFMKIPGAHQTELNAYMIKPPNFKKNKKYPVLMYQYSGPGSQQVLDKFPLDNYWWHQYLAQQGYIIVVADGTGTGGRGEAFKKKTYLNLGKYESDDQIAVAKYLQKQKYVDPKRIGIWGWSYGGYMSSICIMKGANVFKTAIAVAPVTNWRYYDNIYTERYMRTPQENAAGYDKNSPISMVKDLKGKYLLIHGTADDNVHFQNSMELNKELIAADKEFDTEYYPNKNHGISGGNTRLQLYKRMTNFILQNL